MSNDGGPAFPKPRDPYPNCDGDAYPSKAAGMSLRDYFASKSLVAIAGLWKGNIGDFDSEAADRTAKAAYRMADAMLAARSPQEIVSE